MKKLLCVFTALFLMLAALPFGVSAEQDDAAFLFEMSVAGKKEIEVQTGDEITVVLYLHRVGSDKTYEMYGMQAEIRYDSAFFEFVEGSWQLYTGVNKQHLTVGNGYKECYMNYLSYAGGTDWHADTRVGSFRLRVVAEAGTTTITNEDFGVFHADGEGEYDSSCNTLTVTVVSEGSATATAGTDVSDTTTGEPSGTTEDVSGGVATDQVTTGNATTDGTSDGGASSTTDAAGTATENVGTEVPSDASTSEDDKGTEKPSSSHLWLGLACVLISIGSVVVTRILRKRK